MFRTAKQPVILGECVFYFAVLGEHRAIGYTETLRGFALGREEIPDAVFRHDARGLLRQRAPQIFRTWRKFLHDSEDGVGTTLWRIWRCRVDILRTDSGVAYVSVFSGQFVTAK